MVPRSTGRHKKDILAGGMEIMPQGVTARNSVIAVSTAIIANFLVLNFFFICTSVQALLLYRCLSPPAVRLRKHICSGTFHLLGSFKMPDLIYNRLYINRSYEVN